MKKNLFISIFAGALLLAGCNNENKLSYPVNSGDDIVFGAVTSFEEDPLTKTVYGDQDLTSGVGTQDINWVIGDKLMIYSPQAIHPVAEYSIEKFAVKDSKNVENHATVLKTGEYGLQWSNENSYDFYGMYPSPTSIKNEVVKNSVKFEDGKCYGYLPAQQPQTFTVVNGNYVGSPEMDYCYSACYNTVTKQSVKENGGSVGLKFMPLVTAIDITFVLDRNAQTGLDFKNVELSQLTITSSSEAIAGAFEADLTEEWEGGYPVCASTSGDVVSTNVTIPLRDADNKPLKLTDSNQSVTVTAFLLPTAAHKNLSLKVMTTKGQKILNLSSVTFSPHKKSILSATLPDFKGASYDKWVEYLPNEVVMNQLSVPASAQSLTANYKSENYQTQTKTIAEQWAMGVRCFELRGDFNEGSTFAASPLRCNGEKLGITFGDAIKQLLSLLNANPNEFLFIIPSYQPYGGRDAATAFENLNSYYSTFNSILSSYSNIKGTATYTPSMTVGEARGRVMFISRITSEEDSEITIQPTLGVNINTWGSLKDKWGKRGYAINGTAIKDFASGTFSSSSDYMEKYIVTSSSSWPSTLPTKGTANYMYNAYSTAGQVSAWVQDWPRVVKTQYTSPKTNNYYYHWFESLTEKQNDIWDTFIKATTAEVTTSSTTIYINSLDGYYVSSSIENSYIPTVAGNQWWGGNAGDIHTYASEINQWFYNKIAEYGVSKITGPMGIIILDYVGDDSYSTYLPALIVGNNYSFELKTK